MSLTLLEIAAARLRQPDQLFITSDDGRYFTYGQFWQLAGRLAQTLLTEGAKPGDRIAVQVEKSVEAIALFYACVRAGLIFLPLNTAYTAAEISYFLGDAEPAIFIQSPGKAAPLGVKVITLDDTGGGSFMALAALQDGALVNAPDDAERLAAILYTSGTTGKSKGAMLSVGNLASNALALAKLWRFTPDDKLIHALPVYHTHGLFVATNTVFASGGQLLFRRKFDVNDIVRLFPQATALMGVPTFYTRLLQHEGLTRATTQHMRLFVSGSAPLLAETHRDFFERTGHAVLERYGMTETNMNTSNPYEGERRAGTVGMALPGTEVRVREGGIEVRGPNVFKGYWRNPEKTAAEFTADGFFITGDLGHFDDKGYLVISGRAKDLIITGGFNVYPKEVEELIDAMPGVLESAVIGLPDSDFGEAVTAVVVPKAGVALDEAAIIAALKENLASYKCPKRVIVVLELPRNTMGKVQKNVLRKTYGLPV
ncbi:MAG: malonyl-CoA synthase [Alphaproteobacteria bacterium]|nr:malonyl-CoA synthase [Alphaproteobacteria bacterium]